MAVFHTRNFLEVFQTMPSSSAQQQQVLVALPLLCAVCAAFIGYRAGSVAWRRKQKEDQAKGVRINSYACLADRLLQRTAFCFAFVLHAHLRSLSC